MKIKILLSTLLGISAWSLSSVAAANWDSGPCPQPHTGPAPCIETEIGGNTYHINGTGNHAGVWYGRPAAAGGGDFAFSSNDVDLSCDLASPNCNLTLSGEVKKCQDSTGEWRIGVRVNSANVQAGDFLCNFISVSGFPWYAKDGSATPQCPFEDDCDTFIAYDPSATSYTANFGRITVSASLIGTLVNAEYLPGVIFNPGVGANFDFTNRTFTECNGDEGSCSIDGVLELSNGTSLDIF